MRYIIGIAPAQTSITVRDGRLIAWCPNTECGRRLRALVDEDPQTIFRNASDIKPKQRLKNNKLVDRQPWASRGRDLLAEIADNHEGPDPARILVLGLDYWRRALGLLADANLISLGRYKIPTASPFDLHRDDGTCAATITLLPHPTLWPVSAGRDRQGYRAFTIDCLARQNYRAGAGDKRLLGAADYDQAFRSFDL